MKVLLFFCLYCFELAVAQRPTKPPKSAPYTLDCRLTKSGQEYAGLLNTTSSGRRCQAWTSDRPHFNYYKQTTNYPEGSATAAGNKCRNPDPNWNEGVWCYTTSPNVRWEHCNVRFCECVLSSDARGIQYEGRINRARGGQLCRSWASQSPISHPFNDSVYFPDPTVSEASNFCRNPNGSRPDGPWCYIDADPGWDYCLIPTCNLTAPILPTRPTTAPATTTRPPPVTSTQTSSKKISSSGTSITSLKITSSRAKAETSSSTFGRKSTLPTPVPTVLSTTKSTTTARPIPKTRSFAAATSLSAAAEIGALRSEDDNSSIRIVKIVVPVLGVTAVVAVLIVCVVWKRRGVFQQSWKRFSDWIDIPPPPRPPEAAQEAKVTPVPSADSRQTEGFDNPNFNREQQPVQLLAGATQDHSSTDSVSLRSDLSSAAYATVIRPLRPSLA